jgi:hypothetical protein
MAVTNQIHGNVDQIHGTMVDRWTDDDQMQIFQVTLHSIVMTISLCSQIT